MFVEEISFVRLFCLDILICQNWRIMFYLLIYFAHKRYGFHCPAKVEISRRDLRYALPLFCLNKCNTWIEVLLSID